MTDFKERTRELMKENLFKCPLCGHYFVKNLIGGHIKRMHPEKYKILENRYYELVASLGDEEEWV